MPLFCDRRLSEPSPAGRFLRAFLSRFDLLQILPLFVLLAFGVCFVYGTGQQIGGVAAEVYWKRQIGWGSLGLALWFLLTLIDYRKIGEAFLLLYPASLAGLACVLFFGVSRFGAKRWLSVGGTSVQPSEFAKLSAIVFCAWVLSRRNFNVNRFRHLLLILLIAALPAALILKQPNLSTALTLLLCVASMIFAANLKWRWILLGILLCAVAVPASYPFLKSYHKARIMVFLNPSLDPLDRGWNQRQAELAVGSGGLTGKGFMRGTQNSLGYLPQTVSNSDFIFSVIAEETGFAGSLLLIGMYVLLLISVFRCALITDDPFGRYLCTGIGTLIAVHTIVNIGMSLRLTPVTGLPLPLVSYGGTFLLVTLSALGMVQSVYASSGRILPDGEES